MNTPDHNDTLPADQNGEDQMVEVQCPSCLEHNSHRAEHGYGEASEFHNPVIQVRCYRGDNLPYSTLADFEGIITCHHDGHRRPVKLVNGIIDDTGPTLPIEESANLLKSVPDALIQDVKDAEDVFFARVYRASTVMCRRALQLGFQEPPHNIADRPYGAMLRALMNLQKPPLSTGTHGLASSIGDYGGIGAHNPKPVSPEEARSTIFTTVRVLNELFPP